MNYLAYNRPTHIVCTFNGVNAKVDVTKEAHGALGGNFTGHWHSTAKSKIEGMSYKCPGASSGTLSYSGGEFTIQLNGTGGSHSESISF